MFVELFIVVYFPLCLSSAFRCHPAKHNVSCKTQLRIINTDRFLKHYNDSPITPRAYVNDFQPTPEKHSEPRLNTDSSPPMPFYSQLLLHTTRREWIQRIALGGASSIWGRSTDNAAAATTIMEAPTMSAKSAATSLQGTVRSALCDPFVSSWRKKNRKIHLLGTAHISTYSADLAGRLVREVRPDAVFVELDRKRIGTLQKVMPQIRTYQYSLPYSLQLMKRGTSFEDDSTVYSVAGSYMMSTLRGNQQEFVVLVLYSLFNPVEFIQRGILKAYSDAVGDAIKGMYRKLENAGFTPGEEFAVAVYEGLKLGSTIILGDRDVDVTLRRLTVALAKTDVNQLAAIDFEMQKALKDQLPESVQEYLKSGTSKVDPENLKLLLQVTQKKENVKKLMSMFNQAAPEIYSAMVSERDMFMATGLNNFDQFQTIVAVMGIAHVDGVERNLRSAGWSEIKPPC